MVYELGHVADPYKNNNIGVGDLRKEGGFASNLLKKRRRCVTNNVNKFIGNIAKDYMETTEGGNWASNFISHLNCRFPTSIDTPKNFIQQEIQDANLHQIISSHSSLPDLLVSNSYFPPQNDMSLGYGHYSSASVNVYNPILCGGSAYNEYIQNVAYGGMNLISPLGVKQSDLDIITSPEQVSTITACSYGDMISDTEAFDSITPTTPFQQQPFHNSQYRSFTRNNRSAYNMDHPLLSVDDVQSPYPNSCNVQESFQNLPEDSDDLQDKSNNLDSFQHQIQGQQHSGLESSSDIYDLNVLSAYNLYKDMPANMRKEVSFQDYMHATECQGNLCKCKRHLELSSHFDDCNHLDCNICGPAKSFYGSTEYFQLESRKRKYDQSETNGGSGTLLDKLPTKYPKLESTTVGKDAISGAHDQQEANVVDQNDNILSNETMKYAKLESSSVGEDVMDDDQRRVVSGAHDQQETTEVNQIDNIVNNELMKYSKLESSSAGEDTMDDDQRRKVNGSHDEQELIAVNQSDNVVNNEMMKFSKLESSSVGEEALDGEQRKKVNGALDKQELIALNQSDDVGNNEMVKFSKLESSVGEDIMDDEQRRKANGLHDQQESTVVNYNDNVVKNEMVKYPKMESSTIREDAMDDDQSRVVNGAYDQQESSTVGEDAIDDDQRRAVSGAHDQQESTVVNQSENIVNNEMMKSPKSCSDHQSANEMTTDEKEKSGQVIIEANNDWNSSADVAVLSSDKSMEPSVSMVDCQTVFKSDNNLTDNGMVKSPQLCSDHLSSKDMNIDEMEKSGQAIIEGNLASNSVADVADVNSNKSMTPCVSIVNCDSALGSGHAKIKIASLTNDALMKSPQLCSDHLSSKDMTIDEKEKSGQVIIEASNDLNSGTDVTDINSNKSTTSIASMVDCDSAIGDHTKVKAASLADIEMRKSPQLCSDEMAIDVKEKSELAIKEASNDLNSGADVADLNSNKSTIPNVFMVDCDSGLQSDHTKVKVSSLTDDEMMKSTQLCSDHLSSKEMSTDEKEKSGLAITEAGSDLNSGADVADVSMVDCDSALGSDHTKIKIASLTDNEMTKPPPLCSDHLSSKEMTIDEKDDSGQAIIDASNDLDSGADVSDLHSNKSMTPNVSMVDCDLVLESIDIKIKISSLTDNEMMKSPQLCSDHLSSKETTIDQKEKSVHATTEANNDLSSVADVADLHSNKCVKPDVSMVDCNSVQESDNTKTKVTSLTDNDSQLEPEMIKIQSVSLAEFFTADQIKAHLLSFTSQKVVSENRAPSIGPNTCQLCSMGKLVFAPAPIYCSSCDTRIKRNVGYYRSINRIGMRHCFCMSCYRGSHGNNILLRGYGYSIPKSNLQKARNDEEKEDSWVLCDKCQCWQHRICGLYNDEKDVEGKAEYICPKCYLEEIESGIRVPLPQTTASGAKDLPRTNLSDHIEQRLFKRLNQERQEMAKVSGIEPNEVSVAEGLVVRVVVSVEKQLEVRQKFIDILHGVDYPSGFTYRSKLIFLFQKIEGVDVCLFGMCVQEFGSECSGPNQRCVYISYLDSVKYFRPERKCVTGESLRTFVYHEILTGYLEYCKKRGFATCYIWACPLIKGEDYIFYCHPETQRTPKQDKLRQWYKSMLKKATEDNIVVDHTNLYNQFFVPGGEANMKITAARLPYFDGDYWSGAAENIVRKLEVEESAGGLQSKLPNKRILKAMGQDKVDIAVKDVLVMQKLGQTILPVKENFMIVHLQYMCSHCHEVILSGSRWFCRHCKKFQLCSKCFNADKNISEGKLHTCHSGEKNQLSEVVVNDVTLDTKDTDDVFVNSFFETRDAFLNKCQKSHFQFDTLSRAKYTSMMILYHLIYKPVIKPTCTACHADVMVELCWHCDTCTKYYICESCYKMRHGAYHPHSLNPPSMDFDFGSKSQQLQMQKEWPLRFVLDTLTHASDCDRIPCAYKECNIMRRLFYHAARCSLKARGGCKFCKRVWMILKLHSQICTDSDCKIPRCMDIKKYKETLAVRPADHQVSMNDQQEVAAEVLLDSYL